jgi:hypothetical protein
LDGQLSTSEVHETDLLSEGSHTILFQVQDNDGQWSDNVQHSIKVLQPPLPPEIIYFQVSPERISYGDAAMLRWYVTSATTIYLNEGIGNVHEYGSIEVSPLLSTSYTLIASNEGGSTTADINILVIPSRTGLPVINSFESVPGSIMANATADLAWNVSNADYVQIDPGIGIAEPVGSVNISPDATTIYTLTAYSSTGIVTASTQVLVSDTTAVGKADLNITGIARVEIKEGLVIEYTITNSGMGDSPSSVTKLYANGVFRASDTVGPLSAGSSVTRQISQWLYDPTNSVIELNVDAEHSVAESDETNNSKTVLFPVRTVYDFVENASDAQWGDAYPYKSLEFGEIESVDNGMVFITKNAILEDASGPVALLESRPRNTFNGWIIGEYSPGITIEPGCYFYGLVGLMQGAIAGDVTFHVYIRESSEMEWTELSSGVYDWYDYKIKPFVIRIPVSYFGEKVDFSLRVSANGEPLQDWAVWLEAKLIR